MPEGEKLPKPVKKTPRPIRNETVIPPISEYQSLLHRYTGLTEQLRRMGNLTQPPTEKILEIDRKRSIEIHRRLEELAQVLGRSPEEVRIDMLMDQGNLGEYGIDAPLLKLPILGGYFRYENARVTTGETGKGEITSRQQIRDYQITCFLVLIILEEWMLSI